MSFDIDSHGSAWRPAFEAVESLVGGRIVACERQARWRPMFWLDVERPDGDLLSVCFRGGRIEQGEDNTILHEYRCFRALEKNGILVPKIYGYCEKPVGFVMEKSPGRPDLRTAETPEEFDAVRDEFVAILAQIHALPTTDFEAFGLQKPSSARELALGDSRAGIERFLAAKSAPEPALEFLIDWTERNVPQDRRHCCFLTGDAGQFIFERGRVTALLDMEISYLGDPLADLGALFARDLTEQMGDLDVAIFRYEEATGQPVDRRVVLYHAIRFAMTTPLSMAPALARPHVAAEFVQYLTWNLVYSRTPLELIAFLEQIELEEPDLPQQTLSPYGIAHDALQDRFEAFETHDEFQAFEADGLRRLALYLRQADRYGPELLAQDLDEAAKLLGRRPTSWQERDATLSDFIRESAGARNPELVRYLVRRLKREEALLRPAMRDLVGVKMQTLRLD